MREITGLWGAALRMLSAGPTLPANTLERSCRPHRARKARGQCGRPEDQSAAVHVEFVVTIGNESLHPLQRRTDSQVTGIFIPNDGFTRYCWYENLCVKRDHGTPVEGAASFHTTRWTIVMRAAQSQAQGGEAALEELCQLYWYPLYIFARRRGHSPEDAQDLTQSFFLHLLEHRALTHVDRLKGKFRSFLLASFQNHISDAARPCRLP